MNATCSVNHPELTVPLFAYGFGYSPDEVDDLGREQIARYDRLVCDLEARCEATGWRRARSTIWTVRHRLPRPAPPHRSAR